VGRERGPRASAVRARAHGCAVFARWGVCPLRFR
jgi:hypothetical protein